MNEAEIRQRLLIDPEDPAPEIAAALAADPELRRYRDDARQFDLDLRRAAQAVPLHRDLELSLADMRRRRARGVGAVVPAPWRSVALAAAVVLAVLISAVMVMDGRRTRVMTARFGLSVVEHIYHDTADLIPGELASAAAVDAVFRSIGGEWPDTEIARSMDVAYVYPCQVFPDHESVHLLVRQGSDWVNVFVIKDSGFPSPVAVADHRFSGWAYGLDDAAIAVVAERAAGLSDADLIAVRDRVAANLHWSI